MRIKHLSGSSQGKKTINNHYDEYTYIIKNNNNNNNPCS